MGILLGPKREIVIASIFTMAISLLYRCWLICPALRYVSIVQWRAVALVVAAAAGCGLALLRLSFPTSASVMTVALLLGGTWAAWSAPHDVPVSFNSAFFSHLESFWREVLILTGTAVVSRFCCARPW